MINECKQLKEFLKTKCNNVFYVEAPEKALMPYIVYSLPSAYEDDEFDIFTLDVDFWGTKEQLIALEELASSVKGNGYLINPTGLNRGTFYNNDVAFTLYADTEVRPPDNEPRIRRIKQTYQLRKI